MSRSRDYRLESLLSVLAIWLGMLLVSCGAPAAAGHVRLPDPQVVLKSSGITLPLRPGPGTPHVTRAQALAIAAQDMPGPAAETRNVTEQYILLDWPGFAPPPTFQPVVHRPAWLVTYRGVTVVLHGTSQQMLRHPPPSIGDMLVFIDATNGQIIGAIGAPGTWGA